VGEGDKAGGSLSALYGKQRLSQKYGADLAMQQQSKVGDRVLLNINFLGISCPKSRNPNQQPTGG
jgi:hypothetical protein